MSLKWCSNLLTTISIIFKGDLSHGSKPSALLEVLGRLICPTTCGVGVGGMASDRGHNWKPHFMALETLRRFENCSSSYIVIVNYLRSVGFISLRVVVSFVRVIVLSSSGHRWPFFVSSIPFDSCYVVASFSCLRFVLFCFRRLRYMSSLELCISFNCCNCTIFLWIK